MKKLALALALIVLSIAIFLPFMFNSQAANAQTNYSIQQVNHTVQVLYSGQIMITENILLTGQVPSTFELGLPFKYGSSVLETIAYDSNYKVLPVTMGVQLQGQSGFYGVIVNLPSGTSSSFTVVFILSNGLITPNLATYTLDFPAYLGFEQTVSNYNANVSLPNGAYIQNIVKTDGTVSVTNYQKSNLAAFTYEPATATFTAGIGYIQLINFPTLNRQINISPSGGITSTDTYKIVNNSTSSASSLLINIPVGSNNVVARDQFGSILSNSVYQTNSLVHVQNVSLAITMLAGESTIMTLDYSLPSISHGQFSQYVLNLDLFAYFNYFIDSASVKITPPEGATLTSPTISQIGVTTDLNRNAFQESLTIKKQGVSYVDSVIPADDVVTVKFDYNALWIAFRPTSWMWAVAIVGVVVLAIWKRPKGKAPSAPAMEVVKVAPGVTLNSEHIKDFVEAYEEKRKVTQELRSLDARAEHGRIPRRRYKVQRKTFELRLETLSQRIAQLKAILRSAGGTYSDIVRQIEAAEVDLNEAELSLQNIEVRHESGEIPLDSYKKQLTDIERRKEKAGNTLDGLLLRLRGETR